MTAASLVVSRTGRSREREKERERELEVSQRNGKGKIERRKQRSVEFGCIRPSRGISKADACTRRTRRSREHAATIDRRSRR